MKPAAILLGVLCMLSGCGQKGPLYLPDKKPAAVAPAAGTVQAAAPAGNPAAPKKPTDEDASQAPAPK
ncbi:MAG: lipoprotein [Proteobacteria bacterium]|nr:lipoprotein [Pseudomonadota bacterium]